MDIIIGLIVGILVGVLIFRVASKPSQEQLLRIQKIEEKINLKEDELAELENEIIEKNARKDEIVNTTIPNLEKQAKDSADIFYKNNMEIVSARFNEDIDTLEKQFEGHKQSLIDEYNEILGDQWEYYNQETETMSQEIDEVRKTLNDYKEKTKSAIADYKRKQEIADKSLKYRINLTEQDLNEIKRLREIIPFLREQRPLCKMIWEGYYRTPTSALLDRVVKKQTGIYKITNLTNNKVYIGQAVNLADRLRTHIKAGLGIDPTNNEMYKVMNQIGIENFSFEVLQYCASNELNDLEKFWIDYYKAQDFGYNMTQGGAKGDK